MLKKSQVLYSRTCFNVTYTHSNSSFNYTTTMKNTTLTITKQNAHTTTNAVATSGISGVYSETKIGSSNITTFTITFQFFIVESYRTAIIIILSFVLLSLFNIILLYPFVAQQWLLRYSLKKTLLGLSGTLATFYITEFQRVQFFIYSVISI